MGKNRAKGKRKSSEAASASKRTKSTRHEDEQKRQNLVKRFGKLSSKSDWQQFRQVAVSELNLRRSLPDEDVLNEIQALLGDDEHAEFIEDLADAFRSRPSCSKQAEGGHREMGDESNQEIPDRGRAKKKKKHRQEKDDNPFVYPEACLVDIAAGGKLLEKLLKAEKKRREKAAKETRALLAGRRFMMSSRMRGLGRTTTRRKCGRTTGRCPNTSKDASSSIVFNACSLRYHQMVLAQTKRAMSR